MSDAFNNDDNIDANAGDDSVPAATTFAGNSKTQFSLGGQNDEFDYHPLAMDSDEPGTWGWIDRSSEKFSGWLNPILIKEARQSLKSRQFLITFFLLLTASCIWTILGVVSNAPDVYYVPTGTSLLVGYYLVLAIPMIGMVPLAAHRSLASEIDDDTFEMLILTRLSSTRIVMGKLNSAMLQMLVYFAAIVPCLAFCYLLRGVTLPMIGMMIILTFFTALLVTSFALLMATLAFNRAGQTIAMLVVLVVIFFSEIFCFAFCSNVLFYGFGSDAEDMYIGLAAYVVVGVSCIVIFIQAAAARIAPVTENRSTGLRRTMFTQQLVWISTMAVLAMWWKEPEIVNFAGMILTGYWLLMGTLMLSESSELSPRVQRDLPSTFAGRTLLTWFNPGPSTGYVFAAATGFVGIMALGVFGNFISTNRNAQTEPVTFAFVVGGYLLAYLGIIRLIAMAIMKRFGASLAIVLGTLAGVLFLALITPMILIVITTGSPPYSYEPIEAINWGWTLGEMFTRQYDVGLAVVVLVTGLIITAINLPLLFRVFQYRKITVPERVQQEQGSAA